MLKAENPLGPQFGVIPAIAFRYTNEDLAAAFAAKDVPEPYDWAICGNADYALAYLLPGTQPAPTAVELQVGFRDLWLHQQDLLLATITAVTVMHKGL